MADQSTDNTKYINIMTAQSHALCRWQPIVGNETLDLLAYLKLRQEEKDRLQAEAVSVVAHCLPPTDSPGSETGLVIGYVQSGKTMSFTTVATVAKDNNYKLIIVITGITTNLFEQSKERLERDLTQGRVKRRWKFFHNPRVRTEEIESIASAIDWDITLPINSHRTVLITVMKNARHLEALLDILNSLHNKVNMRNVPALIIDDEADQASLNNLVRRGGKSSIYARILALRDALPHHSFLQYTATPQAPLLISLIDVLSPQFAELLSPGISYTGGKTFFEKDFGLVTTIPSRDIPTKQNPLLIPPSSLLEALRIYFVGVAVGYLQGSHERDSNRAMMVHPSKTTDEHGSYARWVREIKQYWETLLNAPDQDRDKQELIEDFFTAHQELSTTVPGIPPFSEIYPALRQAIKETQVTEANAKGGKTPQPNWKQDYSHIVIGGEVLNRGYTIQGLTVTYMPRGKGVGNADTLQQRARWFGYKADYLGYCRVYLDSDTFDIYKSYVEHEEHIRSQLSRHHYQGGSLKEWKRAFFLDPSLRPTRQNVLEKEYVRGNFSNKWFTPVAPHDSPESIKFNQDLVRSFLHQIDLYPDEGHEKRTSIQRHLYSSRISLRWVYEVLLLQFKYTRPKDSYLYTGILLQIERQLDRYPDATCTIYLISQGEERERSVSPHDEILQLFQGANPSNTKIYAGDGKVRANFGLTIQIHTLRVLEHSSKQVLADNVPTLALFIPKDMEANWIVQEK
jgi:hypothetical protein